MSTTLLATELEIFIWNQGSPQPYGHAWKHENMDLGIWGCKNFEFHLLSFRVGLSMSISSIPGLHLHGTCSKWLANQKKESTQSFIFKVAGNVGVRLYMLHTPPFLWGLRTRPAFPLARCRSSCNQSQTRSPLTSFSSCPESQWEGKGGLKMTPNFGYPQIIHLGSKTWRCCVLFFSATNMLYIFVPKFYNFWVKANISNLVSSLFAFKELDWIWIEEL